MPETATPTSASTSQEAEITAAAVMREHVRYSEREALERLKPYFRIKKAQGRTFFRSERAQARSFNRNAAERVQQ